MFLLLDPSAKDAIHLSLFDDKKKKEFHQPGKNRELLGAIDASLAQEKVSKDDILGIMVVVGIGSFTSTRIAAVIANVFGYVRRIPLLAISKDDASHAADLIPKLLAQQAGQYVSAAYSGEPNIGF